MRGHPYAVAAPGVITPVPQPKAIEVSGGLVLETDYL